MKKIFGFLVFFYATNTLACLHDDLLEFRQKVKETKVEITRFCHNYFNSEVIGECIKDNNDCFKENINKIREITFCKNSSDIVSKAWDMCQYRKPWL